MVQVRAERSPSSVMQDEYSRTRQQTEELCAPLSAEDAQVQSMPDVSPAKWHLAHTTWFLETTVLKVYLKNYQPFDPRYEYLFNSYYEGIGDRQPRAERGLMSRPSLEEILRYRKIVDKAVLELLGGGENFDLLDSVRLALEHERQHQELLVTDIKHVFWTNPLKPSYLQRLDRISGMMYAHHSFLSFRGGLQTVGHDLPSFAFDNEMPAHRAYLEPYDLASRPVTNGEYLEFVEEDGYYRPEFWLSDGWDAVRKNLWIAPLYWERESEKWNVFTLSGMRSLASEEPVCHLSFYEADAYARFRKSRLPTEFEWEIAARSAGAPKSDANFLESGRFHPRAAVSGRGLSPGLDQILGDVWEWTSSAYVPYPGFMPFPGLLAEYNGKFMCNQMVLRGGSCATPRDHIRLTYRNFFQPSARWQFSGVRLARSRT
jgi:ergothioneine biosynthesis protein EgtB